MAKHHARVTVGGEILNKLSNIKRLIFGLTELADGQVYPRNLASQAMERLR